MGRQDDGETKANCGGYLLHGLPVRESFIAPSSSQTSCPSADCGFSFVPYETRAVDGENAKPECRVLPQRARILAPLILSNPLQCFPGARANCQVERDSPGMCAQIRVGLKPVSRFEPRPRSSGRVAENGAFIKVRYLGTNQVYFPIVPKYALNTGQTWCPTGVNTRQHKRREPRFLLYPTSPVFSRV